MSLVSGDLVEEGVWQTFSEFFDYDVGEVLVSRVVGGLGLSLSVDDQRVTDLVTVQIFLRDAEILLIGWLLRHPCNRVQGVVDEGVSRPVFFDLLEGDMEGDVDLGAEGKGQPADYLGFRDVDEVGQGKTEAEGYPADFGVGQGYDFVNLLVFESLVESEDPLDSLKQLPLTGLPVSSDDLSVDAEVFDEVVGLAVFPCGDGYCVAPTLEFMNQSLEEQDLLGS